MPYSIPYLHSNDQPNCQSCKKIKTLFKAINTATPVDMNTLTGSEMFPIATAQGLRSITLGQYAQAIGGGGGGGGVPSHSIAEHNNVVGNPQNGDVLTYNNGNWQPSAPQVPASTGWDLNGNVYSSGDFIGTTNDFPLAVKANNTTVGILGKSIALGNNAFPENLNLSPANDVSYTIAIGESAMLNSKEYGGFNIGIGAMSLQNNGAPFSVSDLVVGERYVIYSVGDTDFTLIGANNNTVGTYFFATGAGIGTGTVVGATTDTVAIGTSSLAFLRTGNSNISIGANALSFLLEGSNNIAAGNQAGIYTDVFNPAGNSRSKDSIFIGAGTKANDINQENQTVIGYQAIGIGSNTVVLGNNSVIQTALKGSVTIGTVSSNASAILQADSTTKGFLPPRMTALQAEAIGSPAEGLMVYSTDGTGVTITSKGWWGFDGTNWVKLN